MKKKETKKLTKDQVIKNIEKLKKDLFNFRFRKINGQLEDSSKIPQIKKDVAKILTRLNIKK